jgi:hypothetical protein
VEKLKVAYKREEPDAVYCIRNNIFVAAESVRYLLWKENQAKAKEGQEN